jgi:hypothetical protein
MNECGLDPICQAWNYDPESGAPSGHRCLLKNCAHDPTTSQGKVGGVKFPFTMSTFESNIDRAGGDFKNFTALTEVSCSNAVVLSLSVRLGTVI